MERAKKLGQHLTGGGMTPDRVDKGQPDAEQAVLRALDEHGYCVVENFVSPADAQDKLAVVQRLLDGRPTGRQAFEGTRTRRLNSVFARTDKFVDAVLDPLLLGVTREVLKSDNYIAAVTQVIEILPGEVAQNPHRDDAMFPVQRPHDEFVLSTMLALTDFDETNGATRLYPGSHKWASVPKAKAKAVIRAGDHVERFDDTRLRALEEHGRAIDATMKAGSLLIYRGSIMHGGGANRSSAPRVGFSYHLCQGWLQPQERQLLAVPRDVAKRYPERLQRLLGYEVWPAFGGMVDGRHPLRLLQE